MVTHPPVFAVGEQALVFLAGTSGRLPSVVGGEAGKRHIQVGEDGEETILPGFTLSEVGAQGTTGLSTLDDLAAVCPGLPQPPKLGSKARRADLVGIARRLGTPALAGL